MGISNLQNYNAAKQQEVTNADAAKKNKKPFKLAIATKEELEQLRIPIYLYVL